MIILHLRISQDQEFCCRVCDWIKTITNKFITCYEVATRGHSHTVLTYDKTLSTFRQKLVEKFPVLKKGKRNEYYALAQKDDLEANERYICKGETRKAKPVILRFSFHYNDEVIENRHSEYWDINDALVEKSHEKINKIRQPTFVEYIISELNKDTVVKHEWNLTNPYHKKMVLNCIMKCFGNKAKILDESVIKRHYYGVWNIIDHNRTVQYIYERIIIPMDQVE